MIAPINRFGFLKENYKFYLSKNGGYNWLNFVFCFIILPFLFSIIMLNLFTSLDIKNIFFNTLNFFSILIGFLITSLIFLITFNTRNDIKNKVSESFKCLLVGTEKLVEKLSYHILTLITFSILAYILILFYPENLVYVFKDINIRYFDFVFLFFIGHLMVILLNVLGLLGYIIKFKFGINKKSNNKQ
ncbi:MAG: hypothetical protein ABIJ05_05435 [Patescibacteria group bacterium]